MIFRVRRVDTLSIIHNCTSLLTLNVISLKQVLEDEPIEADATHQSTSDPDTHKQTLRHRTNLKTKFGVNQENVTSGEIIKSKLQVGKDDVISPGKKTVKDEVDIMVDALQLKS